MNRHTRGMFSPSWAYRVGYHSLSYSFHINQKNETQKSYVLMEVGPDMSGRIRIPSRQAGCPRPLHGPASVNPADTVLSACWLYTPGIAPGTLCFSLLAPHDTGLQMRDPHRKILVGMQTPADWLQSLAGHCYTHCLWRFRKVLICMKHAKGFKGRKLGKPVIEGGLFKAHPSNKHWWDGIFWKLC